MGGSYWRRLGHARQGFRLEAGARQGCGQVSRRKREAAAGVDSNRFLAGRDRKASKREQAGRQMGREREGQAGRGRADKVRKQKLFQKAS